MKVPGGSRGRAPLSRNSGTRWGYMDSFMLLPPYAWGRIWWYPLNRRLVGLLRWSGHLEEERNFLPLPGIKL